MSRSDLAPFLPGWGTNHGFDGVVAAQPGLHNVCAYAINVGPGSHVLLGCRSVQVLPPHATRPVGSFDTLASVNGAINLAGWALDPDTTDPIDVHVYVDGVLAGGTPANRSRTDVGAVFPWLRRPPRLRGDIRRDAWRAHRVRLRDQRRPA